MSDNTPVSTRRKFLGMAGMMGAGAVLSGCTQVIATHPIKPNMDAVIFNFALNLEYLEAAFYLAAVGRLNELNANGGNASMVSLPAGLNATNGTGMFTAEVMGAGTATDQARTAEIRAITQEIAEDELAHVKVIRAVLGGQAASMPRINLSTSFSTAASLASGGSLNAAGDMGTGGALAGFNPYANPLFFLHGAFVFEDVGVTAYKGAARLLVDDKPAGNLENAAGILAVEAYHAGTIRTLLYQQRAAMAAGLSVAQIVQAISNLRDAVDGADDRDQGIVGGEGNPSFVAAGSANIVPTDVNAIAFSRTPRQVANIVQLNANAANRPFSFFPEGLNGPQGGGAGYYNRILSL